MVNKKQEKIIIEVMMNYPSMGRERERLNSVAGQNFLRGAAEEKKELIGSNDKDDEADKEDQGKDSSPESAGVHTSPSTSDTSDYHQHDADNEQVNGFDHFCWLIFFSSRFSFFLVGTRTILSQYLR